MQPPEPETCQKSDVADFEAAYVAWLTTRQKLKIKIKI